MSQFLTQNRDILQQIFGGTVALYGFYRLGSNFVKLRRQLLHYTNFHQLRLKKAVDPNLYLKNHSYRARQILSLSCPPTKELFTYHMKVVEDIQEEANRFRSYLQRLNQFQTQLSFQNKKYKVIVIATKCSPFISGTLLSNTKALIQRNKKQNLTMQAYGQCYYSQKHKSLAIEVQCITVTQQQIEDIWENILGYRFTFRMFALGVLFGFGLSFLSHHREALERQYLKLRKYVQENLQREQSK